MCRDTPGRAWLVDPYHRQALMRFAWCRPRAGVLLRPAASPEHVACYNATIDVRYMQVGASEVSGCTCVTGCAGESC